MSSKSLPKKAELKKRLENYDAIILGAGVSGLTTAMLLQALGIKPILISDSMPRQTWSEMREDRAAARASAATNYAMASAYPHHLQIDNLESISDLSQKAFAALAQWHEYGSEASGVTTYELFEVFEQEPEEPPLASRRRDFGKFWGDPQYLKSKFNVPTHPGADYLWGWKFRTYFVDMPVYMRFLWSRLEHAGLIEGQIDQEGLTMIIEAAGTRPIFNCLGYGAVSLFNDNCQAIIMRGQQIFVPGAQMKEGAPNCAYNYTPRSDLFSRADGKPEYLHFFPRKDGFLLGQTREPGTIDDTGNWQGEAVKCAYTKFGKENTAAPIVDLNAAILKNWLGLELTNQGNLVGRRGYRYYRDPAESGVRIAAEPVGETVMIHNYGHGGSGITMSWGCALAALEKLGNPRSLARSSTFTSSLAYMIKKWALENSSYLQ